MFWGDRALACEVNSFGSEALTKSSILRRRLEGIREPATRGELLGALAKGTVDAVLHEPDEVSGHGVVTKQIPIVSHSLWPEFEHDKTHFHNRRQRYHSSCQGHGIYD